MTTEQRERRQGDPASPRSRVPAEHRVLGMDRRTFGLAAAALAVYLLWAWVVPRIDRSVPFADPVEAGDVVQVTPRVTMVPAVGWDLQGGLLVTDRTRSGQTTADTVVLVGDGVSFYAQPGPFDGTPAQLLDQATLITSTAGAKQGFRVVGERQTITTRSGLHGVAQGFRSTRSTGLIAAFVADEGIEVQVVGAPAQMTSQADEVYAMVDSLTEAPAGTR